MDGPATDRSTRAVWGKNACPLMLKIVFMLPSFASVQAMIRREACSFDPIAGANLLDAAGRSQGVQLSCPFTERTARMIESDPVHAMNSLPSQEVRQTPPRPFHRERLYCRSLNSER